MISKLTGKLIEAIPPQVVIDINGVAYEADVSMQTFYTLPPVGETVSLYTQLIVREDAHLLFGFGSHSERNTFRQLIKVSGIGAKTALGILSAMNADELAAAIAAEDIKRLSSAPGIGKKTAQKMVLALKGQLTGLHDTGRTETAKKSEFEDIITALINMGYDRKRATETVESIAQSMRAKGIDPAAKEEELFRTAIVNLSST